METPVLITAAGSAAAGGIAMALWRHAGLWSPLALAPLALYSFIAGLTAWMRMRMKRLADEEARDAEAERSGGTGASLFTEAGADLLPLGRSRTQLERFVVPLAAPACAALLALAAHRIHAAMNFIPDGEPENPLLAAAACGGLLFAAFLASRFLLGLGRETRDPLLRAPARGAGLLGSAAALTAVAAVGRHAGFHDADRWAALALLAVQGLVALELLLNWIASFYRPRQSRTPHLAYESRVAGLLTRPEGLLQDLAQTLEYQFGWEVSERRLARGLARVLLPLAALQAVLLWLSTALVFVDAGETALLERAGKPVAGAALGPGAHLKWPWPVETVRRFPTGRLLRTQVGFEDRPAMDPATGMAADPRTRDAMQEAFLWTVPHYASEDLFLAASQPRPGEGSPDAAPFNLLTVNVPVEYRITNAWQYAYHHADPQALIRAVAYREITRLCMTRRLEDFAGAGRDATMAAARRGIQAQLDARAAGVEVTFVGLQGVHPPVAAAPAYELEIGALEERDTEILRAERESARWTAEAEAEAETLRAAARADSVRRVELARATAARFQRQAEGWKTAPGVFMARRYFDTLESALKDTRKIIVAAESARRVTLLDLEEPVDLGVFELQDIPGLAPGKEEKP